MIWIVEIPIVAIVIAAMLIGDIRLGPALRSIGGILLVVSILLLLVGLFKEGRSRTKWFGGASLVGIQGLIMWLIGLFFGEHNLFEFFFGTGWF